MVDIAPRVRVRVTNQGAPWCRAPGNSQHNDDQGMDCVSIPKLKVMSQRPKLFSNLALPFLHYRYFWNKIIYTKVEALKSKLFLLCMTTATQYLLHYKVVV